MAEGHIVHNFAEIIDNMEDPMDIINLCRTNSTFKTMCDRYVGIVKRAIINLLKNMSEDEIMHYASLNRKIDAIITEYVDHLTLSEEDIGLIVDYIANMDILNDDSEQPEKDFIAFLKNMADSRPSGERQHFVDSVIQFLRKEYVPLMYDNLQHINQTEYGKSRLWDIADGSYEMTLTKLWDLLNPSGLGLSSLRF